MAMSIRYKFFGAFSIVIALACGLAIFGIQGISTSGDLVVRLYDGPLMGINHARSAHAALNEARLLMDQALTPAAGAPKDAATKLDKVVKNILEDLDVVRDRAAKDEVKAAREKAESLIREWADAG